MVSEGGAVQFHERRGSRLRSSISAAAFLASGAWPKAETCKATYLPVKVALFLHR